MSAAVNSLVINPQRCREDILLQWKLSQWPSPKLIHLASMPYLLRLFYYGLKNGSLMITEPLRSNQAAGKRGEQMGEQSRREASKRRDSLIFSPRRQAGSFSRAGRNPGECSHMELGGLRLLDETRGNRAARVCTSERACALTRMCVVTVGDISCCNSLCHTCTGSSK